MTVYSFVRKTDHNDVVFAKDMNDVQQAAEELGAREGRRRIALYDDFTSLPNGAIAGREPTLGPNAWLTTGAQLPAVSGGRVVSSGSGYLYTSLDSGRLLMIGGDFSFGGSYGAAGATLAICRNETELLNDFAHLNFGAEDFVLTIRKDASSFETVLANRWSAPVALDGTTYRFALLIDGENAAVFGPHGEVFACTDNRIPDALGDPITAFWQATTANATDGYLHRAWAFGADTVGYPSMQDFIDAVIAGVLNTRDANRFGFSGGFGYHGNTYIGPNLNGYPSIRFGPLVVKGELYAQMNIGASTFQVFDRVVTGGCSVTIGIGDNAETFTTSGYPSGTGPYTHTVLAAATKTHPAGEGFIATGMSTREIAMNLGDGSINFPNFVVHDMTNFFLGGDYTVRLDRPASDVLAMGAGDSFKVDGTWNGGTMRLGSYYLWVDGSGKLRIKASAPSSDTDGTVVGTQS